VQLETHTGVMARSSPILFVYPRIGKRETATDGNAVAQYDESLQIWRYGMLYIMYYYVREKAGIVIKATYTALAFQLIVQLIITII